MYRSARKELSYLKKHRKSAAYSNDAAVCVFCSLHKNEPERIRESTNSCLVIENLYPYDFWDHHRVTDHLMIVPKRHVQGIHELNSAERNDYWKLLQKYEGQSYNFYARAGSNTTKSVHHQHGHLIKTDTSKNRMLLFLRTPMVRIVK